VELKVSIWGRRVRDFLPTDMAIESNNNPIILLLTGCLVKLYQGNINFSPQLGMQFDFNLNCIQQDEIRMLTNYFVF